MESVNEVMDTRQAGAGNQHKLAFAGLFLFTLLLYARPNEALPGLFGDFPIVRIVGIASLVTYAVSKLARAEKLTIWPIELKMVLLIALLGFLSIPLAASSADGFKVLTDVFLKVVAIFILMINLIDSRARLRSMMRLVVISGTILACFAIANFVAGKFVVTDKQVGIRIAGVVGGIFGNPNDLATSLALLVPLAVGLAMLHRGLGRLFYFACAGLLGTAVVLTFSRSGFLGLLAIGVVLWWKFGKRRRLSSGLGVVLIVGFFLVAMPVGYSERISSIIDSKDDATGSFAARRNLLERATYLAATHTVFGLGIGNFHIYSIREQRAHNSYLEISAELGVLGLIAYLIMLFAPLRYLRAIQRDLLRDGRSVQPGSSRREMYYLSAAVYACLIGYIVCSFFGSLQYLWFVYYPLAYAIAIKRIHAAEDEFAGETLDVREQTGVLWGQRDARPALEAPARVGP